MPQRLVQLSSSANPTELIEFSPAPPASAPGWTDKELAIHMTDIATATRFNRETLQELERTDKLPFAAELRRRAFEQFEAMPVPSPDTEEWRYTDLRDFDLGQFTPFVEEARAETLDEVKPGLLEAAGPLGDRAGLSIQHNSTVVTTHVDPSVAAKGVIFTSLDEAVRSHTELVERRVHDAVPTGRTRFTALHGAFRTGGTFIHIPAGVSVELPLQTLTYVDRDDLAVFPHTVLILEEGAELTFIDRYISPDLGCVLSDAVVEIYLGPGSRLRYVSLQDWGRGVTHLAVQRAVLDRDSDLRSLGVTFGASLSRSEVESVLEGDGGSSEMLGVYFADGDQHFDHRSIQDHRGSLTTSDLLYKGVLKGRSRTIYSGTVIIQKGAHKCNAYQTNRNILLSDQAKADSIPNLEILSNDPVRCGHAASVGPVDEDTLFYIQSRGIPFEEARKLVVFGFLQEVLDRVTLAEVRQSLEGAIAAELDREET
jgi:Fe-S cluster assembly protein SufD